MRLPLNKFIISYTPILAVIFFVCGLPHASAQSPVNGPMPADIDSIKKGYRIDKYCSFGLVPSDYDLTHFDPSGLGPLTFANRNIAPEDVDKKILLRFRVANPHDTAAGLYLFPWFYFPDFSLYHYQNGTLLPYPRLLPDIPDSMGYRYFTVNAHDTADVVAVISMEKTYTNSLQPRLVSENYLESYMLLMASSQSRIDVVTFVFCGIMLMMVLFSLATFIIGANREFLFYVGYALMLGLMLFTKSQFNFHINKVSYLFESYIDFILFGLGYCFYMIFMIYFIETKKNHPFLHRLYRYSILVLVAALILFTVFHFTLVNYYPENIVENSTKFFLLAMAIVFMIYTLRHWKDRLLRFLFWGNFCLLLFSLFSQLLILLPVSRSFSGLFRSALFYYEIGVVLELIFFLIGLAYKNRKQIIIQTREKERLEIENERKELEKQMAVMAAHQEERDRISADMHDELGSGMTTIRLMSEIAKNKMKHEVPVELEKISQSANDVLNKMNAIIWSMNSGNDSLDNLVSYIRAYSLEYFDGTPVACHVDTPEIIPVMELSGDKRRNIFLCVKESLNNILKHSGARNVNILITTNHRLSIIIKDNGTGIDLSQVREFGNGLKNITRRMEKIGGSFKIENDEGTKTTILYPFTSF